MTLLNAIFFLMKIVKKFTSHIPQTYSQAIPILSALKIIHPITAKKNVKSICPVSFKVGKSRPSATWLVYLRFLPVNIRGKNKTAWYAPQAMNVQFAPCQKPESKNMTKVFLMTFVFDTRLPPKGI